MSNFVTFEDAKKLERDGFPKPFPPTFSMYCYNRSGELCKFRARSGNSIVWENVLNGEMTCPEYKKMTYAPTVEEVEKFIKQKA